MSKVIVVQGHQVEAARRLVEAVQSGPDVMRAVELGAIDYGAEQSMLAAEFVASLGGFRGNAFPVAPSGAALTAAYLVALLLLQP